MARSTSPARVVADVMHHGVIDTPPQTSLQEVAALMAGRRMHCVVVEGLARGAHREEELVWGIVSDLDLIKAVAAGRREVSAGEIAATEIVTVETTDTIEQVAQLMAEHECTHLIVVSALGEPVGVISSLDVAGEVTRLPEFAS